MRVLAVILAAFLYPLSALADPTTAPLIGASDITFVGKFAVDNGGSGCSTFSYGGYGLSFYKDAQNRKTLFMGANGQNGDCAGQIQVPSDANLKSAATAWSSLYQATILQPPAVFTRDTAGANRLNDSDLDSGNGNPIVPQGFLVWNNRLIVTLQNSYSFNQTATIAAKSSTTINANNLGQTWGFQGTTGSANARAEAGYFIVIPTEWRALLGGPVLTGSCCWSVISTTSGGPALSVIDPDDVGVVNPVPSQTLLHYQTPTTPLACPTDGACTSNVFNLTSRVMGGGFVPNTRTVFFVEGHGTGTYCYGTAAACGNDPVMSDVSGPHAQPYRYQILAYDANDLIAVKNGTQQTYQPRPYNQASPWVLAEFNGEDPRGMGATLDSETGRLYIRGMDGNNPTIYVYQVAIPSGTTYTVTPSAGANGSISPNTPQTINSGSTTQFTVTPNSGYTASVGGTCGGSLVGTTYTTNAITANCTVAATFADITAPSTPTDMDARSSSTSTVDLSWVASTDAVGVTSYRVDYCSGYNCSSWATLGTSATNAYQHTGITPAANPTIYRYRVYALDAANNLSTAATSIHFNAQPTIPAFPGAEGGGATSKGGRGGTVYRVTSLLGDTSAGTLRACIAASGPRTCVFAVAGNIELTGNINISLPYITIDGSTAPGDGITISGKGSTQVSLTVRTHNVTIRGIRIRKGYNSGTPDQDGDSVNVLSASATASPVGPVIFDHVSVSWGQDENGGSWALTTRSPKNITYQWSMMYEPLLAHPVNFMTGAYNNATAELMTNIDFHHSFLANSSHRNPLIKNKTFRLVNNLIYNWGDWATAIEGTVQADLIGNKYKTGPLYQTISSKAYEIQLNPTGDASTPISGSPSLYVIGNIGPHNANPLNDNWGMTRLIDIPTNAGVELGPLSESYRRVTPLAALPFPITTHDVATAESSVLAGAGASRRLDCAGSWVSMRDSADTRVVAEYTAGNAGIIPTNEDAVGGYPTLSAGTACTDTDGDGMPDTWETANGLNINSAADGPTLHASGYSNLEMYLAGPSTETTPVLSNLLPTSNLARTATSATLQATTDQTATCRYALGSGTPYAGMTPFTSTANTAHSSSVSVVAGGVYQYCVRCMGTSLVSDESCTRFAVDPNPKKRVLH